MDTPRLSWRGPLPATWSLVALLVLVHLASAWWLVDHAEAGWTGALLGPRDARARILVGGQYLPLVAQGEGWRLVTSTLLHVDGLHLAINLVALAVLGRLVEPLLGPWRWLGLFVVGSALASWVSHLSGIAQSDGASGGAFALLGAAIAVGWRWPFDAEDRRLLVRTLGGFAALNVALSLVVPALDAAAHTTGLVVGGVAGLLVRRDGGQAAWAAVVLGAAGIAAWGWLG